MLFGSILVVGGSDNTVALFISDFAMIDCFLWRRSLPELRFYCRVQIVLLQ